MDAGQQTLFVAEDLPQCFPDAPEIRERLQGMLAKMRAAASWPWKPSTVSHYRETVWPALLAKLPDADEAARLRAAIETEIARLADG